MDTSTWTPQEMLRALQPWIAKQRRYAWLPRVELRPTSPTEASFCGQPYLASADDWPTCGGCHRPLQLYVQLDLDALPAALAGRFGSGYLQLFYCRHFDDGSCIPDLDWEPFNDKYKRVHIVQPSSGALADVDHNSTTAYPPRAIVGWERIDDYPINSEYERLGLTYSFTYGANPSAELHCPELNVHCVGRQFFDALDQHMRCHDRDKLGGWPHWIQWHEYPACPRCGSEMQFIMQIDSEDNIPVMFGDSGMGYLTQCPQHLDVVAFGWACC